MRSAGVLHDALAQHMRELQSLEDLLTAQAAEGAGEREAPVGTLEEEVSGLMREMDVANGLQEEEEERMLLLSRVADLRQQLSQARAITELEQLKVELVSNAAVSADEPRDGEEEEAAEEEEEEEEELEPLGIEASLAALERDVEAVEATSERPVPGSEDWDLQYQMLKDRLRLAEQERDAMQAAKDNMESMAAQLQAQLEDLERLESGDPQDVAGLPEPPAAASGGESAAAAATEEEEE